MQNHLRNIPPVHELLASNELAAALDQYDRELVTDALRQHLDGLRQLAVQGHDISPRLAIRTLADEVALQLAAAMKPRLRRVINGTGVLLHTNLGRAPMAEEAVEAAAQAARGYLNLELDLNTGKRSHRPDAVRGWLTRLLGCEAATVVNNNAAATVIALRTLAAGKEVIVSRGELVEIGGSFRIPEIMAASGAILKEVGATNITRISDYEQAITPETALLLRVHTSNYRLVGHTEAPTLSELVDLSRTHSLPFIDDIGSGSLIDLSPWGFTDEPLAATSLACGADLVMFSGDKLLGGPQCGILAGRAELIERINRDPLMRAFRVDKMTLAALEATLRLYLNPEKALDTLPLFQMLSVPLAVLQERAYQLARYLGNLPGLSVHVADSLAYVGGGSLPNRSLPSVALALRSDSISEAELAERLRLQEPAIMGRLENGQVMLDLRTIPASADQAVLEAISHI